MLQFEEALSRVIGLARPGKTEIIDLRLSLNRILAEEVSSDISMPPFNKSAMDGYACKRKDLSEELDIIEIIPAGKIPGKILNHGQCSKIMTGAMMPEGADCVIMVEHTEQVSERRIKFTADKTKDNYVPEGEDVRKGEIVLDNGLIIKPQHIAVLASVGCSEVRVYRRVRTGIISTGDELVEPYEKPGVSQIRNSNAYQLCAQVEQMGGTQHYLGIAKDSPEDSEILIREALNDNDVIILTGGVSMGDYDFIPQILEKLDVKIHFDSLAVQPGRPTVFGTLKDKVIFGLPGNPVSSFNIFELLVRPMLYKMMGYNYHPEELVLPMGKEYNRNKSSRRSFLPMKIRKGKVFPLEYHGSAHINALIQADGLIEVPIGIVNLKEGEMVNVRQI